VAGKEREAEGEVGAGEDGEGLDEDVGDGLITRQVRVELVSEMPSSAKGLVSVTCIAAAADGFFQIELIIILQWAE
jgi:hypothetical protein